MLLLTPNIVLRSGSLNLNGILDTCSLLGVVWGFGAGSRAPLLLLLRRPPDPLTTEVVFDSLEEAAAAAAAAAAIAAAVMFEAGLDVVIEVSEVTSPLDSALSKEFLSCKRKHINDEKIGTIRNSGASKKFLLKRPDRLTVYLSWIFNAMYNLE